MFASILKLETTEEQRMDSNSIAVIDNLCSKCLFFNRETGNTCEAFPEGIPTEILIGDYDHTFEYDQDGVSDQGVTFSPLTN